MAQLALVQAAAQVVAVIPTTPGAPTTPGHVILFLGVRIARLVARTHAGFGVIVGVDHPVPRCGRSDQRGSKNCGTSQQCEFRHTSLHSVVPRKTKNAKRELRFRSWFRMEGQIAVMAAKYQACDTSCVSLRTKP